MDLTGCLFGLGNPLLDITAEVDDDLLAKYNLQSNSAILAEEKHLPLYEELIKKYKVLYSAGGASQNSIRVAQWMLQHPGATSYSGCIGEDAFGEELRKAAEGDGVGVPYLRDISHPTGTCAVLINHKKNRSLVANLGAANFFRVSHLYSPAIYKIISKARIFYVEGYFLIAAAPSTLELAKMSHDAGKVFTLNISAPYICTTFKQSFLETLPFVDILFGNDDEFKTFAKENEWDTSNLDDIVLKVANWQKVSSRPRLAICTYSDKPSIVATEGRVSHYTIKHCPPEEIVDTNGAGDAFVGGFLSQYVRGSAIQRCMDAAHYAAWSMIRVNGTSLPGKPYFQ